MAVTLTTRSGGVEGERRARAELAWLADRRDSGELKYHDELARTPKNLRDCHPDTCEAKPVVYRPIVKKASRISMPLLLTLAMASSLVGSAPAQQHGSAPGASAQTTAGEPNGPTSPAELEAFLDELLTKQMDQKHIAGAAVSVVKDGELFFAKGYGYANIGESIPVDPAKTVFPIGSVAKLFTWTAVMQLVERGKLDLEADVNAYLDFHIPDTFPRPITLQHLLTHTPGFEERMYELDALNASDLVPSGKWLASHIPARVRPPGEIAAYSNYGAALAGYIVARVSGEPYDEYVQEHILNPLGMEHTTAQAALPERLRKYAPLGYTRVDGTFQRFPDYMAQTAIVPAGGIRASADDMARFMIAHLQGGRYGDGGTADSRILNETTVRQMQSTLYTADPRLQGTAYGFFDFSDNGQHTLGHSGGAHPFYSMLMLLPERHIGIFVVYDGGGGGALTLQHLGFQRAFFDHYYPAPAAQAVRPPKDFAARAGRFVGTYRVTAGSYTTLEKILVLMGSTIAVANPGDGTLLLETPWGNWPFVEVTPLFFRSADGAFSIVFRQDVGGRITHVFTSITPMFGFEKLRWYETPGFNMALLSSCLLVFLSLIALAVAGAVRGRRRRDRIPESNGARAARWIIVTVCSLGLLFVAGTASWGNPAPLFGVSTVYEIVLGLGVLSAVLTAAALVFGVVVWKSRSWGVARRVHYTVATLAALGFVWFLNQWNLLGWRY